MNNILISIIMPAYNAQKYIKDAIQSVLAQTYSNWELIIIDDCSNDNTRNIIEEFSKHDNRIKPIYRKHNSGKPSVAKNSALEYIEGEYIAFLDSDDLWLPQKLEKQMHLMNDQQYFLCYTGGINIDENSKKIGSFLPKYENGDMFRNMLRRYEINNQSVLIKKEVFSKFDESIIIGEDYKLFLNIVYNHKVCNIKEELIQYRCHASSITNINKFNLAEGTISALLELNNKYHILKRYPIEFLFAYIKAYRFIILNKLFKVSKVNMFK